MKNSNEISYERAHVSVHNIRVKLVTLYSINSFNYMRIAQDASIQIYIVLLLRSFSLHETHYNYMQHMAHVIVIFVVAVVDT